jgi:3-hydroxyanthranilate 3,4-dioxygenase
MPDNGREKCMELLSTYHLKRWVQDNKEYFNPPFRTNRLIVSHKDFLVMILRGPNTRLDFHIEPGDEFFYQVEGDMELHLKPEGERRQVVTIREGEIFVSPGGLAHSPRRFENTWGLVIERKRRPEEKEEFAWFCEKCDELVLSRVMDPDNIPAQVSQVYQEFNNNEKLRTCRACGYVFSETPMAERLGFLETKK